MTTAGIHGARPLIYRRQDLTRPHIFEPLIDIVDQNILPDNSLHAKRVMGCDPYNRYDAFTITFCQPLDTLCEVLRTAKRRRCLQQYDEIIGLAASILHFLLRMTYCRPRRHMIGREFGGTHEG